MSELEQLKSENRSLQCAGNDRKNALELADRLRMSNDVLKAENARLAAALKGLYGRGLNDLLAPTIELLENLPMWDFIGATNYRKQVEAELARLRAMTEMRPCEPQSK